MFEAEVSSAEFGYKHLKIYQLNRLDDLAVFSVLPLWTSKVVVKEMFLFMSGFPPARE